MMTCAELFAPGLHIEFLSAPSGSKTTVRLFNEAGSSLARNLGSTNLFLIMDKACARSARSSRTLNTSKV